MSLGIYRWRPDGPPVRCKNILDAFDGDDANPPWQLKTDVGEIMVSTVFLRTDHDFTGTGPPILFETMVFGGGEPWHEFQERYTTQAMSPGVSLRVMASTMNACPFSASADRPYIDPDAETS